MDLKKVISFSLWGDQLHYYKGAIRNCEIAKELYSGWKCFFYIRSDSKIEYIEKIRSYDNAEVIMVDSKDEKRGLFWRFLPAFDNSIDITIIRDCDSRISLREVEAVNQWINSSKSFHIMRDHPYHNTEILGGMWGVKNKKFRYNFPLDMEIIKEYKDEYQEDQRYLRESIWPLVKDDAFIHDSFFTGLPFPSLRNAFEFVGQQFDENDNPNIENINSLKKRILM